MPVILELDRPEEWPMHVRDYIGHIATSNPEYIELEASQSDQISNSFKDVVNEMMREIPLVVYHATKLLTHEIDSVYSQGLQGVNAEMLTYRIKQALKYDCISTEFATFLCKFALESANHRSRKNIVWVFTSRSTLRRKYGLNRQFNFWGGEALRDNFEDGHPALTTLREIGEPAIVRGFINLYTQVDIRLGYFDMTFNLLKAWGNRPEREQSGGSFSIPQLVPDNILEIITEKDNPKEWLEIAPMSDNR